MNLQKVTVDISISVDGYGAGPNQDLRNPIGLGRPELHSWLFEPEGCRKMHGQSGGSGGVDNEFAARSFPRSSVRVGYMSFELPRWRKFNR
jgi:hypothetical protein